MQNHCEWFSIVLASNKLTLMHLFRNQLRQCECTESLPLGMPFEFKFDIPVNYKSN